VTIFNIEISGDREARLRLEQFPDGAYARMVAAMEGIEARLEAAVLAAEPARTGALRSITGGQVYHDNPDRIAAVVGVRAQSAEDAKKAGVLEYGSRGTAISVGAHQARLGHFWSRAVSPIMVTVGQHSRVPNIVAQRFLRGPIDAIRADAIAELQAALDQSVKDAET
jgi:hypothetical protein